MGIVRAVAIVMTMIAVFYYAQILILGEVRWFQCMRGVLIWVVPGVRRLLDVVFLRTYPFAL
jgi:type IV secretory pathway TrbD component